MATINKEEVARRAGMAYAIKIIDDAQKSGMSDHEAIEHLKEELRYRNITRVPISITKAQMKDFTEEVKTNCTTTFKIMTMLTLHDEFGFGEQRLTRFGDRFDLKCECLIDDYATWLDYQQILWDECKVKIDMSDEFIHYHEPKERR